MQPDRRTITQDHYAAVCYLAELGRLAFRSILPQLSHDMLYGAVLVSLGEPLPVSYLTTMKAVVTDPESSGPERRCYGFLAAVVEHLGLVEPDATAPPPPKQLALFP